jgi:hypothetical protein
LEWELNKFRLIEEKNIEEVCRQASLHGEEADGSIIKKAVAVWHDDLLCGYFLTVEYGEVKSFHGFKFVKGGLKFQFPMMKKYIEEEKLEYSLWTVRANEAMLKLLGFKEISVINNYHIMRRDLCLH